MALIWTLMTSRKLAKHQQCEINIHPWRVCCCVAVNTQGVHTSVNLLALFLEVDSFSSYEKREIAITHWLHYNIMYLWEPAPGCLQGYGYLSIS